MENYTEKQLLAKSNFEKGYNCAQAVAVAFCKETGLTEEQLAKIVSGFGGGMGRMRDTCGAVAGAVAVYGYIKSNGTCVGNNKLEVYEDVRTIMNEFSTKNGSYVCKKLLEGVEIVNGGATPDERTEKYYKVRPCADLVADSAGILEKLLNE